MPGLRIILFILFVSSKGFSQLSDSLFYHYKNENLSLRRMDLTGNLNGSNNNSDFLFNGNGTLNYDKFTNCKSLQADYSSGISINHDRTRQTYLSEQPFYVTSRFGLNSYYNARHYNKSETYWGLGYEIDYNYNHSHFDEYNNSLRTEVDARHQLSIQLPIFIGIGRKYPVYSVHKSLWIYSELAKNHALKRNADERDCEQLAHLIDQNIYTRYFDSRYKTIEDMSRVDSLLRSQDILNKQDIRYFTTLYDMYYYSSGTNRFRGHLIEAGVFGNFQYDHSKLIDSEIPSNDYNSNYRAAYPILFAQMQNFKAINLHWQFDYLIRMEYGFSSLTKKQNNYNAPVDQLLNVIGTSSLSFYPNTRSYLNIQFSAQYGNASSAETNGSIAYTNGYLYNLANSFTPFTFYQSPVISSIDTRMLLDHRNFFSFLALSHYYYISPPLRLQTFIKLIYDKDSINLSADKFRTYFGASFSYALF